jgi:hypothetical protein
MSAGQAILLRVEEAVLCRAHEQSLEQHQAKRRRQRMQAHKEAANQVLS